MSDVYDINRIVPADAPAEFPDDVADTHFVPAPCQVACPVGTDAPSYLAYIWEDKFEEAFEAITATNPFSSICGRVCDAPCEPACRRADSDGPIAIRNLKRYVMERLGKDFTLPGDCRSPKDKTDRHRRLRAGGSHRGPGLGRGRLRGPRLRDDRPSGRHDGLGHPGFPPAARHDRGRPEPHDGPLPGHQGASQLRPWPGRHPRGAESSATTRCC